MKHIKPLGINPQTDTAQISESMKKIPTFLRFDNIVSYHFGYVLNTG
jgi:hypothetical protein